jgi:hypothetical protein
MVDELRRDIVLRPTVAMEDTEPLEWTSLEQDLEIERNTGVSRYSANAEDIS